MLKDKLGNRYESCLRERSARCGNIEMHCDKAVILPGVVCVQHVQAVSLDLEGDTGDLFGVAPARKDFYEASLLSRILQISFCDCGHKQCAMFARQSDTDFPV